MQRFRVIAFDLPGFGSSSKANLTYTPERYARFMHHAIRPLAGASFDLMGYSLGGCLVIDYAARHPDVLRHLVVVDAAGMLHRDAFAQHKIERGLNGIPRPVRPGDGAARALASVILDPIDSFMPNLDRMMFNRGARDTFLSTPGRIASLAFIVESFGPAIHSVRTPTPIVWGEHDDTAPRRTGELLAGRIPGSTLVVLPNAGHDPIHDQTEAMASLVLRYLEAVPGDAPRRREAAFRPRRDAACYHQDRVTFEGDFDAIFISHCSNVRMRVTGGREGLRADSDARVVFLATLVHSPRSRLYHHGTLLLSRGDTM